MVRRKSIMAGMTDYTGYSLDEIREELGDWINSTKSVIEALKEHDAKVVENELKIDRPHIIRGYIEYWGDLLMKFEYELNRLIFAVNSRVESRHVELARQLFELSQLEDKTCIRFAMDHLEGRIKDESQRHFLDRIYADVRGLLGSLLDISNVAYQLKTYVGEGR